MEGVADQGVQDMGPTRFAPLGSSRSQREANRKNTLSKTDLLGGPFFIMLVVASRSQWMIVGPITD